MIQENEIPKYLKQTESNISKSNRKSKHKHHYEECLIQYDSTFVGKINRHTRLTGYCTICGKIGSVKNGKYETELEQLRKERQGDSKFYVFISGEEIYERYYNKLPVFSIDDPFADYVVLDNSEGEWYYEEVNFI